MTIAKYRFIEKNPERMRIFFRKWFAPENAADPHGTAKPDFMQVLGGMIYMVRDRIARGEIKTWIPNRLHRVLVGIFNSFDLDFISLGLSPSEQEIKSVVSVALTGIET